MRTWMPGVVVMGLMAIAFGGGAWSAFFAGERDQVRSIKAYAEKVCINDDVRLEIRGSLDWRLGSSFFREWETVAAAERDLKSHRWRLRALTPPAGLGRFHAAALDSLRDALDELGEQTTPGGTVRVGTIPMGGLPSSWGIREALSDLPGDTSGLMYDHGCYATPLAE